MNIKLVHVTTIPLTIKHFLRDQIAFMRSRGLDVAVVSSPGPILDALAAEDSLEVWGVPMERPIAPVRDLVSLVRLIRLFRKIRPTIVHGSTAKAAVLSMLAARLARVPIRFYTVRGLMTETRSGLIGRVLKVVEWLTCLSADRVLPVSNSVGELLITEGLCSPQKIGLLENGSSNGVDAARRFNPDRTDDRARASLRETLGIPREARIVGFVGRIVKDKGIEELIDAWSQVLPSENAVLLMLGAPEPQDPVSQACLRTMDENDRIVPVGWVAYDQMYLYYSIMDFLVLPSHREGFPNTVLEAAAMERPAIVTRATGCVDAVRDSETGILVPLRDSEALARAMKAYLQNPGLCRQHGRAAREWVLNNFCQPILWEALHCEYVSQARMKGIIARAAEPQAKPETAQESRSR